MHATNPMGTDFTYTFSVFAAGVDFSTLPEAVLVAAERNIYDTLSCSIAGVTASGVVELDALVRDWGGKPEATVLWSSVQVPAPQAAWVNGVMSHARDYDDTHDAAILHAGVSVVPAALAAAEIAGRPIRGQEFLAAVAVGLEFMCRIGMATRIGIIESGFIYSSLFGYFGATAAAAHVLRFTPDEMVNAIGIAFSQAAGTHQVTRDAALTKRMQPAFAARAALTSVAMARSGIRGAQRSIEGVDGLSRIYLQSKLDPEALRGGLGTHFHMVDLAYKPYPCCRFNHTPIDAALQLRGDPSFDWRTLTKITVGTNRQAWEAVGTPLDMRRAPTTVVQAQFSSPYTVACALVNGRVGLADFVPEALGRPDVLRIAALVEPVVDADIEAGWSRNVGPARIEAVAAGTQYAARADHAKGSREHPMTNEEVRSKLEDCLRIGGFDTRLVNRFDTFCSHIRDSHDIAADLHALMPSFCAAETLVP